MKRVTTKRITAFVLAMIMTLSLCPVTALAELLPETYEMTASYVAEDDGISNDELFAAYVQREIDASLGYETPGFYRSSALEDGTLEKEIYDALKAELAKIADGDANSSDITIYPTKGWSAEELGVEAILGENGFTPDANAAITDKLSLIYACLLADCPLELYWHDKTLGVAFSVSGVSVDTNTPETMWPNTVSYVFIVAEDYRDSSDENNVTTDTTKTGAAAEAVANAQAIVEANAAKSDMEKLTAYKDAICNLVSYNETAADSGSSVYGIDPWQMVYVFDGNSTTNVVCEGYAKAFQYLCDLTNFDGDVECHTVQGYMSGGTGAGGHMWNVVTMDDGKNYLVDVTNCDSGTIGADDKLFMAYTANSANNNQTHTFTIEGQNIVFTYGSTMADLFCDGYLALSTTAYTKPVQPLEATATLTGSTEPLSPGDTVTLTFSLDGNNIGGVETTLHYDSDLLAFVSAATPAGGTFASDTGRFEMHDFDNPINALTDVLSVTLQVKEGIAPGTELGVSFKDIVVSDANGNVSLDVTDATWEGAVAGEAEPEYVPLYWSDDGGATYHNSIEEPVKQKINNNGYWVRLYTKNNDTYTAIDEATFGTITKLSEDIGFFGWTNDGKLFWNTENVTAGTESGAVFTVGDVQYLVNLYVLTAADGAAAFVAQYAKNPNGNLIDISNLTWATVNRIRNGLWPWLDMNSEERAAANALLSGITFDDMLAAAYQWIYPTAEEFVSDFLSVNGTPLNTITAGSLWNFRSAHLVYAYLSDTVKSDVDSTADATFASLKEAGTTLTFSDVGAAAVFIMYFASVGGDNKTLITQLNDNSSGDAAWVIRNGETTWYGLTAVQKSVVNKALKNADANAQTYEEMLAFAKGSVSPEESTYEARWFPAGTSGWEDRGTLADAVIYANTRSSGTAYIQLLSDVNTSTSLVFAGNKTTILDLNGHTIDRGLTEAVENGEVILVNGNLTVTDSSTTDVTKQGKITGGYTAPPVNNIGGGGGGVSVFGDFTLNGGVITENMGTTGGVWVVDGDFTMNGGTITGNTASDMGGGVYVNMNCTFEMNGGTISNNIAEGEKTGNNSVIGGLGGGVYNAGTFIMTGGTITGNTAMFGGGVCGKISVSGTPVITENLSNLSDPARDENVFLFTGKTITVVGKLNEDASIGVTTSNVPTAANPVTVAVSSNYTITEDDTAAFSGDAGFTATLTNDGSVQLVPPSQTIPEFAYDGEGGIIGALGVLLFTDLQDDTLYQDFNLISQWDDADGDVHSTILCGEDKGTVYLGVTAGETLTVDGTEPERIGTWTTTYSNENESWDVTYIIYKLTADKPDDDKSVEYAITNYLNDEALYTSMLHFDFVSAVVEEESFTAVTSAVQELLASIDDLSEAIGANLMKLADGVSAEEVITQKEQLELVMEQALGCDDEDQALMLEKAEEEGVVASVQFFDITVALKNTETNETVANVADTKDAPLTITVDLSREMLQAYIDGMKLLVMRVHDSETEFLNDEDVIVDEMAGTVTFKSSKFSSYAVMAVEEPTETVLLGDVTLDGEVDAADMTALVRHVAGIEEFTDPRSFLNGDVDADGDLLASDITKLTRYVAGIITEM